MELKFIVVEHDLDYYIDLFLRIKRAARRPATVAWYENSLRLYRQVAGPGWPPTQASVLAYLEAFETRGLSESSRDDYWRALRAFINWCRAAGFIQSDPLAGIDAPKTPHPLPKVPDRDDVQRLITVLEEAAGDRSWMNCRDLAIISVALDTGARIGEMDDMLVGDVDLFHQQVRVYGYKVNAGRMLKISDEAATDLGNWLLKRSELALPHDYLWPGDHRHHYEPLTHSGIRRILARWQKRAGVAQFTFNQLRHAYATYSHWNGAPLADIKEQLGHSSIRTTAIYTQIAEPDRLSRHRQTSARRIKR